MQYSIPRTIEQKKDRRAPLNLSPPASDRKWNLCESVHAILNLEWRVYIYQGIFQRHNNWSPGFTVLFVVRWNTAWPNLLDVTQGFRRATPEMLTFANSLVRARKTAFFMVVAYRVPYRIAKTILRRYVVNKFNHDKRVPLICVA